MQKNSLGEGKTHPLAPEKPGSILKNNKNRTKKQKSVSFKGKEEIRSENRGDVNKDGKQNKKEKRKRNTKSNKAKLSSQKK